MNIENMNIENMNIENMNIEDIDICIKMDRLDNLFTVRVILLFNG